MRDERVAKGLHDSIVQGTAKRAVGVGQDGSFAGAFGGVNGARPGNGDACLKRCRIV